MVLPVPPLDVLLCSDEFRTVWTKLAFSVGAEPRLKRHTEEVAAIPQACGVLIDAAGAEAEIPCVLQALRQRQPARVAVVGMRTDRDTEAAVLSAGADSYFALPHDLNGIRDWMARRVESVRPLEPCARAAGLLARGPFPWVVGSSPSLLAALERIARVIPRGNATVLLTGETGTGKDLLARTIHDHGPRGRGPFIEVNCNALPAHLLEAELFGFERGAFTDARAAKPGLFEIAGGGTLFLDEIGDLPVELQGKLLRVLETRRVRRLGSVRDLEVDVRIITATHRDLAERTRTGHFRADLFYRLNVVPIHLPPLRERGDDILRLAQHFLERLTDEHGLAHHPVLTPAVRHALLSHSWPGNVRELRNALERALVLGDGVLRMEDLFGDGPPPARRPAAVLPFPAPLEEIERAAARAMVLRCDGNKSQAADLLRIGRKRLYALLNDEGGAAAGGGVEE